MNRQIAGISTEDNRLLLKKPAESMTDPVPRRIIACGQHLISVNVANSACIARKCRQGNNRDRDRHPERCNGRGRRNGQVAVCPGAPAIDFHPHPVQHCCYMPAGQRDRKSLAKVNHRGTYPGSRIKRLVRHYRPPARTAVCTVKDHFNRPIIVSIAEDCEPLHPGIVAGQGPPAEGADLPGKKFRSVADPECSLDNFGQHGGYGAQSQAGTPVLWGWILREIRRVP